MQATMNTLPVLTGAAKSVLLWLARASDAGHREWLTPKQVAEAVGLSTVSGALFALDKITKHDELEAPITGALIEHRMARRGGKEPRLEVRITDDGLIYALDHWPKETLTKFSTSPRMQLKAARKAASTSKRSAAQPAAAA